MHVEEFMRKVLLENALKYDGVCNPKSVLGAVMREFPDLRANAGSVMRQAGEIAQEVNALSVDEQKALLESLGGSQAPEKEYKDPFLLDHPSPVLRFEPSPSGPLHIGHAFTLGLNHLLAAKNDGKLILRIADTNPENIYPPAYELIVEDAQWYTHNNISDVFIQSDRMELYYSYAERMLSAGWAYVCTCDADAFRECVDAKQPCPCRDLPVAQALMRWQSMLTTLLPGEAVVRIKTDIAHKNPAMRDWPALRINTATHPKQGSKYRVWPLMNFSVSVDDMEMGVTHVLRAKDHADNAKRQEFMYNYFGKPIPVVYNVGRINFTDLQLSTSQTRKRIEDGDFSGWDDVRLPFFQALKKRGFTAEAFLRQAQEIGISPADKKLSQQEYFTNIEAFNRDIIDKQADRIFFVQDPVLITIQHAETMRVEKDLYPELRAGGRVFELGSEVYVSREDIEQPEHVLFRLMDGYNFSSADGGFVYEGESLDDFRKAAHKRMIHYLPKHHPTTQITLVFPDGSRSEGIIEARATTYPPGTLLQCERIGFVRKEDDATYYFAHR